ncbi:MAG: FtsX-like permease family protein [Bacteroidales bacterium]|jgi:ABC-type lipoprotein release transport system permease subunit|nr:FtsX-like permease family protein [Bacteroidales bacterium]
MMAFNLAFRNLLGAGLRTWLNVIVLSFSFVIIIWTKGLLQGWDRQARHDMIKWEIGGGQYWHASYDPYDPFTLSDSHGAIPEGLAAIASDTSIVPVLIAQGTIFPAGRMQSVLIKGIPPEQKILALPTEKLVSADNDIPAIIGSSMAENTRLGEGDYVTLRWRDRNGTFDATEIRIAGLFETTVPTVDVGQVWIPLEKLREMMLLPGEATVLIAGELTGEVSVTDEWVFKDHKTLLADIEQIIKAKGSMGVIIWGILLLLAMLAVFDTQVFSIFRRQKEIGTYVALGMTRGEVVKLFTIEGAMNSVLAAAVGAIYGIPLLTLQAVNGISIPVKSSDYGLAMAEKLYPVYSIGLIAGTVLIVMLVTTIVSYWPSRKIARLNPTEALRGRMQ